jgi:hypothetical protein
VEPVAGRPDDARADSPGRDDGRDLDAYFDRLDAALGGLQRPGPEPSPSRRTQERRSAADDLPTVEQLLAGVGDNDPPEPSSGPPRFASASAAVERPGDPGDKTDLSALADALGARLGGSYRVPLHDPPAVADTPAPVSGEALIEEVTRRVLLRLAPSMVNDVATDAVMRVVERMVREELDRIRDSRE